MSTHAESVFVYWKKSLAPFKNGQFKLFFLGTLATFKRALKLFFNYFWWIVIIEILLTISMLRHPTSLAFIKWISHFCSIISFYAFITSTRASTEAKNSIYYKRYLLGMLACIPFIFTPLLFRPLLVFAAFFFLDSKLSLKNFFLSIKRAIIAVGYFFPAFGIVILANFAISALWSLALIIFLIGSGSVVLTSILSIGIIGPINELLYISTLSVLYTKLKHEYFSLLFE